MCIAMAQGSSSSSAGIDDGVPGWKKAVLGKKQQSEEVGRVVCVPNFSYGVLQALTICKEVLLVVIVEYLVCAELVCWLSHALVMPTRSCRTIRDA